MTKNEVLLSTDTPTICGDCGAHVVRVRPQVDVLAVLRGEAVIPVTATCACRSEEIGAFVQRTRTATTLAVVNEADGRFYTCSTRQEG